MSNFAIVGFIYSQACPLRCNFCCHTPAVVGDGRFTPDEVARTIIEFAAQKTVIRFAFSGGDPFLFIDEIIYAMGVARDADVKQPFHVVTSGYWASSPSDTTILLDRLKQLGMDALDVSYDVEHSRFVPKENILNIANACDNLRIKLDIFGNFWHTSERLEDMLPPMPGVQFHSALVMPIGAARQHFNGVRYEIADSMKYSCGRARLYDIAIYPDGSAYPCCSGGFNKEAGLELGNIRIDKAQDILMNAFSNFHVRIAKEIGFEKLYQEIERINPSLLKRLTQFSDVDSVCEICRNLHRDDKLQADLVEIYETMEVQYVMDRVEVEYPQLTGAR